jgi:L-malate glycosyltransferase
VARQLGVADDVHFLGEQDALVPLLSAADVFLLPSTQESFGLAALEAMACGVPVVASRVGGVPEVVEHGVSGFLHPPDDLDGMAQSVRELLTDDELRRRVGDAAARAAHGRFCEEMIVPQYEAYYAELLARPGRS